MQVIDRAAALATGGRPVCAALGIFDGVHCGHQAVLGQAVQAAREQGGRALAVTFDRHPNVVVAPDRVPPFIQSLEHRLRLFSDLGLDAALVIPFDEPFSRRPAEAFIGDLARDIGALRNIAVGEGFTFGYRRGGTVELLRQLGHQLGFEVHALPPVHLAGQPVRSTRIRECIRTGELAAAAQQLGRPYSVFGRVLHGDRLGRRLGFPTANVEISGLVVPPSGVYAARVAVGSSRHPAVLNLGCRPTLGQPHPRTRLEVHLLDFEADLYDQRIEVWFDTHLRDERAFPSLDALRDQIRQDVAAVRDWNVKRSSRR